MKEEKEQLKILFELIINDMLYICQNYKSNYDIQSHQGVQDSKTVIDEYYYTALLPSIYDILVKRFYADLDDHIAILSQFLKNLIQMVNIVTQRGHKKQILNVIL